MFILITAFYLGILFFDLFNKLISRTINFPVSASFHNLSYAYYLIFYYLVLYIIHFLDRCHSYTLYGLLLQLSRSYISYNHACKRAEIKKTGKYAVDWSHNCKLHKTSGHNCIEVCSDHYQSGSGQSKCSHYARDCNCGHT